MAIAPGNKDDTKALAREVGARSVGQLEAGLGRILAENGPNSRWLLGALVLLNGGGVAVAASQTAWLAPQVSESAISFFVIGAALAVLAALASSLFALFIARQIGEASAQWTQVATSGELSDAALKATGRVRQTSLIASLTSLGIGLLALILFVAGALTLAGGLAPAEPVSTEAAQPSEPAQTTTPVATPTPAPAPANTSEPEPAAQPAAQPPAQPTQRRTPPRQPLRQAPAPRIEAVPLPQPQSPPPAAPVQPPAQQPATTPPPAG